MTIQLIIQCVTVTTGTVLFTVISFSFLSFASDDASKQLLANLTKTNGEIADLTNQPRIDIHIPVIDQCTPFQVHFECLLYTCSVKGLCNMVPLLYTQPIVISKDGLDGHTVILKHSL